MIEFYYASINIIIFAKLLLIGILISIAIFTYIEIHDNFNDFFKFLYKNKKPFFRSEKKHHEIELATFNIIYKPKIVKIEKIFRTVLIVLFLCIFSAAFDFAFIILKKDIIINLFSKFNMDFINNIISNNKNYVYSFYCISCCNSCLWNNKNNSYL